MYCAKDDISAKIKSYARFFAVEVPESNADADGLLKCLGRALAKLGVTNILDKVSVLGIEASKPVLVGGGTDGASVNISDHKGMKRATLDLLGMVLFT